MGSQPIRMKLGKILQEILAGNSCRKFLWENLVGNLTGNLAGKSCGKSCRKILQEILQEILWENLAGKSCGKSCGKFLRENLVGNGGEEKANLRKAVIGGNLVFGIG